MSLHHLTRSKFLKLSMMAAATTILSSPLAIVAPASAWWFPRMFRRRPRFWPGGARGISSNNKCQVSEHPLISPGMWVRDNPTNAPEDLPTALVWNLNPLILIRSRQAVPEAWEGVSLNYRQRAIQLVEKSLISRFRFEQALDYDQQYSVKLESSNPVYFRTMSKSAWEKINAELSKIDKKFAGKPDDIWKQHINFFAEQELWSDVLHLIAANAKTPKDWQSLDNLLQEWHQQAQEECKKKLYTNEQKLVK